MGVFLPCIIVAITGLVDDVKGLTQPTRLALYFCGSLLAITQWNIAGDSWGLVLFFTVAGAVCFTWLINLFNFMDGIDGIAATEAIFVLAALAYFSVVANQQILAIGLLCATAPIIGFLLLNWSPAKIFMGDAGSTFLGCLLGCIMITAMNEKIITLCSGIILLGSFIVDASWTLAYRIITRQKWHAAHRSHLYQILSRRFQSHKAVSLLYAALNLCWLFPLAALAIKFTQYALIITLVSFLPMIIMCFFMGAGKPAQYDR